jgi:formylglycine-generating enzyme required for sulfatase activity
VFSSTIRAVYLNEVLSVRKKILFLLSFLLLLTIAVNAYAENPINENNPLGNFATIPAGTYEIGSPDTEPNRWHNEHLHKVKLSQYDIGETGVTQEQYVRIIGTNPSKFKNPKDCPTSFKIIMMNQQKIPVCSDYPVENVNWDDATEYARLVSENDPKYIYRLPTEAQLFRETNPSR